MSKVPHPSAILFDWDNTLIENWLSIQAALNAALADAGREPFDMEQVLASARFSGREVFARVFGPQWQRPREIFLAHFAEHHLDGIRIMPGAEALLAALGEAGIPMGIVSNKLGDLLRREVAHLGWSERFFGIVGAQDAPLDKPHPAPILMALEKAGIEAGPAVWVVGDTDIDMRAALAAGCTAVLVGPGPQDSSLLTDAAPARRFDDCDALAGFVRAVRNTISQVS